MSISLIAKAPPLREQDGALRIGRTRVTLESVVWAYQEGATPETIKDQFPALDLADIYDVLAHYLRHEEEVTRYLKRQARRARATRGLVRKTFPKPVSRAQLRARRRT